jgi:hypothetical protein
MQKRAPATSAASTTIAPAMIKPTRAEDVITVIVSERRAGRGL